MKCPSMQMVWHEAGNSLYHDRFRALAKLFDLQVYGPERFQGVDFNGKAQGFVLNIFKSFFCFHWLTYFSPAILWRIARSDSDILYVHEEPHSCMAFFLSVLRGKRKFYLESSVINRKGNFHGLNIFERYVYRSVDIIFPKNEEVAAILKIRGADGGKIASPLGNGVSLESFFPIEKARARSDLCEKYGVKFPFPSLDAKLVIGYAGRIWRPKGLGLFPELIRIGDVMVLACGSEDDEVFAKELRTGGVVILPKLELADLRNFYSALDLFVLPSRDTPGWREQFGRVCAEAIYCGTPAIGSNVGGIPMVVGLNQTFQEGNVQAAMDLVSSLNESRVRDAVLQWQRQHIENNFSWTSIAKQVASASNSTV